MVNLSKLLKLSNINIMGIIISPLNLFKYLIYKEQSLQKFIYNLLIPLNLPQELLTIESIILIMEKDREQLSCIEDIIDEYIDEHFIEICEQLLSYKIGSELQLFQLPYDIDISQHFIIGRVINTDKNTDKTDINISDYFNLLNTMEDKCKIILNNEGLLSNITEISIFTI